MRRQIFGAASSQPADVVHDDIDAAEPVQGERFQVVEGIVGAHVTTDARRLSARSVDRGGSRGCALTIDVRDDDSGTALR